MLSLLALKRARPVAPISDAGLVHLQGLTNLVTLHVSGERVTDAGLEHLQGLTGLLSLTLDGTGVTDAGLKHLQGLTRLLSLNLPNTGISDAGLEHLQGLTELTWLSLSDTRVSVAGVQQLNATLPKCVIGFTSGNGPFVILARGDKAVQHVQRYATLAEAVAAAAAGDTIEIRSDGRFVGPGIFLKQPLTIRAGVGSRPIFEVDPKQGSPRLLTTSAALVLEGLEFQCVRGDWKGLAVTLIASNDSPLHITNCRFVLFGTGSVPALSATSALDCEMRNCQLLFGRLQWLGGWDVRAGKTVLLVNNIVASVLERGNGITVGSPGREGACRLVNNTLLGDREFLRIRFYEGPEDAVPVGPDLQLEVSANVFDLDVNRLAAQFDKTPRLEDAEALVRRQMTWREKQNVYGKTAPRFWLVAPAKVFPSQKKGSPQARQALTDWEQFWGLQDTGSLVGDVRYQGGDILTRLAQDPGSLTPEDFRLAAGSAGKGTGESGRDLGADVDLVGPGPAYERWKQTPAYQQWLKESGQKK